MFELYKFNQEEALNYEKFCVRTKRKFVPFSVPGQMKKFNKYLMSDFERAEEDKRFRLDEDRVKLKSFEIMFIQMM